MGRALYRESGPSQDGDPVPGNLPFFVLTLFYNFFFSNLFLPINSSEFSELLR